MPNTIIHRKGPVGCLLIHGFSGTPNELMELAEYLAGHDVTIFIPTLPGHATYSADLFNYTWRDWFNHVKRVYADLRNSCEEVFVGGLSMGGTLALHLAAHYPANGVIAMSAAVELPLWQKYATRLLKDIKKFHHKRNAEDVHDRAGKQQLNSYLRYPFKAVDELFRLLDHVRADLPEIEQPLMIFHSKKDHTVPYHNSDLIFNSVSSKDKWKIVLEESYHVITVDEEKEQVQKEVLKFIRENAKLLPAKSDRKRLSRTGKRTVKK